MPIKNKLGDILAEREIGQSEIAKMVGCSRQTISNIVVGKFQPSFELAFRISNFLNMPITDIFYYEAE